MSSDPSQDKKFDAKRYALRMWHLLVSSLKNIKSGNFKKWIAPGIALILSIILLWNLGGKVREEVWAYYTDGEDINISAEENKARYVLWEPPSPTILPQGENTKNIKKGPSGNFEAAFSSDGRKMAIVLEQENGADIFVSNWDGLAWSSPEPLSKINSKFNERGPSFSLSGNRLFFSSDRDGGLGGYDIYVTTFDGEKWGSPQSLGSTLNSSANETGPAPSMDESGLYFSSDREGKSDQDIFYAKLDNEDTKEALSFLQPIAVDDLNSRSDDIQAALTRRGSLVFMSSDRQSDSRYGVYMSRIIDGQIRDPERVDLYLKNDNVTDPAVRMDGFDLLFSTDYGASDSESSDYRLYRSTTREVFGYYDSSRWEEFKLALGKLKWWLIAALAALLALIYLLETWQDITSLLHKCIAASIAAHLLLLLLATAWFITQEFEPDPESELSEIEISLDALAQEELAMESAPEEAQISDPTEQITIEKSETSFDIPELQAQDLVENVVDTNTDFQDSMEIEVEASQTQIEENTETPKLEQSSLIAELSEPTLPEIDDFALEEDPNPNTNEPEETEQEVFEPSFETTEITKAEISEVSDSAVESESESEAVESGSLVAEATEAESQLTESGSSNNELSPTSELATGALPELAMLEPGAPQLEELEGEPGAQPADTSEDTFEPSGGVAKLETEQEASGATSDSAVESESESEAVESGSLVAEATEAESQLTESGSSNNELSPTSELATGALPELAMLEPGAPQLEELEGEPGAQPADTSEDTFEPSGGVAKLETEQEASGATSDSAVESESESEAVESGSLVAEATEAESQLTESGSSNNELSPTSELATGALPELAMLEPGAPQLEELEGEPGAQPADTSEDTFEPSGGVAKLETEQEASGATSDSAVESESESEAVESGSLVAEATEAESQLTESGSSNNELSPTSELATGALPELAMLEPGAPQLEELEGEPGAQPADTSEDTFEPSGGVAKLETEQEASGATSDSAVESESESEAVESGSLVAEATEAESQLTESGSSNNELSPTSELATGALPVYAISAPLLPDALEDNQTDLKKGGLTELIKKHRGKPSLEVIKQLGGSDATEKAIIAAIEWLSKVQEKDGRWDTRKFQAETDYDVGGTALALLCYYGWGARHDRPGKYQNNVKKALEWLLAQQREDGSLARRGMMYSHAIAAIALCEAYGITKDDNIKSSALAAIEYTISSQHQERGGWRYSPGQDSDTSVTGWQLMALHSARMAGLELPEKPFDLARRWLDFAGGGEHGGLYGYQSPSDISRAMVATGMFCRQLDMVPPSSPKMIESAELMKRYPIRDNNPDLYYIYYGTLALYQHQGPIWQQWNNNLKRILPDIQIKSGSLAGSWDLSRSNTKGGGRIASTTLAILSLEVYYRILPMYGFRGEEPPEAKIKLEDTRQ